VWPWFVPAQTWARGKISWYFIIGKDLVFALVLMGVNYAMATSQDVAEGYRSLGGFLFGTIIAITSTHLALDWARMGWSAPADAEGGHASLPPQALPRPHVH